jgi:hypothetical protein
VFFCSQITQITQIFCVTTALQDRLIYGNANNGGKNAAERDNQRDNQKRWRRAKDPRTGRRKKIRGIPQGTEQKEERRLSDGTTKAKDRCAA